MTEKFTIRELVAQSMGRIMPTLAEAEAMLNRTELSDPSFCPEHKAYFAECGHLGHGDQYDPKELL